MFLSFIKDLFWPSRCLVLQYDSRPDLPHPELRWRNREYCRLHNYSYIFETRDTHLAPYWMKVYLCNKYISHFDYILWLDSDAAVHNPQITIPEMFPSGRSVVYSINKPEFSTPAPPAPYNAGVFAVRGTEEGKTILADWMSRYPRHLWYKEAGKWLCTKTKDGNKCAWAGIDYEEGAFLHYIIGNPAYKKDLYAYPTHVMQGHMPVHPDCYVVHFAAFFKKQIPAYVSAYAL
jgi:hypothetical protein